MIIVVMGYSNAGKDTVANAIQKRIPYLTPLKFSAPMKAMLEHQYCLEPGSLEDRDLRNKPVPDPVNGGYQDFTYLDVMVKAFEHYRAMDPFCMLHRAKQIIDTDIDLICTDLRTPDEAQLVANSGQGVWLIQVVSHREVDLESDRYLWQNLKSLKQIASRYHLLLNVGSKQDLEDQVDEFIRVPK